MVLFNVEAQSRRLGTELDSKFRGHAKIALDQLFFDSDKEPNDKKIDHLQRIFKRVGCDRRNPNHFISGSISADVLQASLRCSNQQPDDLLGSEPPELRLPAGQQVHCLSGRHRVLALKKFNPSAAWWPVKLFIDLTPEACRLLEEEFANEAKYSDGEIVANILRYPEHSVDANQWWARLDKSKPRTLKKILSHSLLAPAFKKVLGIPGLRPGLLLATWHKILPCAEEVVHSLQIMYQTWVHIVGSEEALKLVDKDAVAALESRVPGVSYCDEQHADSELRKEGIFRAVRHPYQRKSIFRNLKQVTHLIPSIHTLQQDFKYLRQCTSVMRKLIGNRDQIPVTVQTLARMSFRVDEEQSVSHEEKFLSNLKLLYLHIMQDVCQLSAQPPLRDSDNEEDYELLPYSATAWHKLAVQATNLGFSSDGILQLCRTDPDREVVIRALHLARPPDEFEYGPDLERTLDRLMEVFRTLRPVELQRPPAELTSQIGERIARRCGRVYSNTYDKDRHFITFDNFTRRVEKSADITSLFVRRSVFHAFWGWHDRQDDSGDDMANDQDDGDSDGNYTSMDVEDQPEQAEDQNMPDVVKVAKSRRDFKISRRPQQRRGQPSTPPQVKASKLKKGMAKKTPGSTSTRPQKQQPTGMISAARQGHGNDTLLQPLSQNTPQPLQQNALQPLPRDMCVLVRMKGTWEEAQKCTSETIIAAVEDVRARFNNQLYLYNKYGRGIGLEDCPNCEDCVCLSMDSEEGFPVGGWDEGIQ